MDRKRAVLVLVSALLVMGVVAPAAQAGIGPNASFQAGNFSHWSEKTHGCFPSALAEFDTFAIGFTYPGEFGGAVVPSPPGGHAAIFGQTEPSWGYVSRTFTIPRKARRLSFKLWWFNRATPITWLKSLVIDCPGAPGAQMIYASLIKPGASPKSLRPKDRLLDLWQPQAGTTPYTSGSWRTVSASVKKLRGKRVTFRFLAHSTRNWLNAALTGLTVK